jgi:hypothetical protein
VCDSCESIIPRIGVMSTLPTVPEGYSRWFAQTAHRYRRLFLIGESGQFGGGSAWADAPNRRAQSHVGFARLTAESRGLRLVQPVV